MMPRSGPWVRASSRASASWITAGSLSSPTMRLKATSDNGSGDAKSTLSRTGRSCSADVDCRTAVSLGAIMSLPSLASLACRARGDCNRDRTRRSQLRVEPDAVEPLESEVPGDELVLADRLELEALLDLA